MKAVVLEETRNIVVREVPDAEMRDTTDVLLRLASTPICGTDLHFYEGRMRGLEGQVIGHEPLGVVEEVGSAVKEGELAVPWPKLFNKNVSIAMGRDDDKRWNSKLRDMIITGAAKPSQVVSHRLCLDQAPNAFAKFDERRDGYVKVILKPS